MPPLDGKRVVIFGDSLSTNSGPGAYMAISLQDAGARVYRNARVGRSAYNFYGREDHVHELSLVRTFDPQVVFVMLGTNDIGLSMTKDRAAMSRLRDALAADGAEVWGIGPPRFSSSSLNGVAEPVVSMMRDVFGPRFIDARPLTVGARTADGIHFTSEGASHFGSKLAHAAWERADPDLVVAGAIAAVTITVALIFRWFG